MMLSAVRRAGRVTPAQIYSVCSNLAEFGVLESGDSLDPFNLSWTKTACQRRSSLTFAEVVSALSAVSWRDGQKWQRTPTGTTRPPLCHITFRSREFMW